jgi:hypothetical protein
MISNEKRGDSQSTTSTTVDIMHTDEANTTTISEIIMIAHRKLNNDVTRRHVEGFVVSYPR